jgi:hypothetical protein
MTDLDDWAWLYYVTGTAQVALGTYMLLSLNPGDKLMLFVAITLITTGLTQIALGAMGRDQNDAAQAQIEMLEEQIVQRTEMCSSEDFETASISTGAAGPLPPMFIQ